MSGRDSGGPAVTPEEAEYFRSIEERFCALRGAAMLLSPRDWGIIAGWWSDKVPLSLILESLEDVFVSRRHRGDDPGQVNSLAYAKPEVLRRWRLHREMTAPRRGEVEEMERLRMDLRRHLGRAAGRLKETSSMARDRGLEALARVVLEVASELRRLRKEADPERWDPHETEKSLEKLDTEILDAARASLGEEEQLRLEREAEEILKGRRLSMKPDAYRESLAAVRERLLRREFSLPHLSLLAGG